MGFAIRIGSFRHTKAINKCAWVAANSQPFIRPNQQKTASGYDDNVYDRPEPLKMNWQNFSDVLADSSVNAEENASSKNDGSFRSFRPCPSWSGYAIYIFHLATFGLEILHVFPVSLKRKPSMNGAATLAHWAGVGYWGARGIVLVPKYCCSIRVFTMPGLSAMTTTPEDFNSSAKTRVSATTAHFVAQ